MLAIPSMVQPSPASTVVFVVIVLGLCALLVAAVARSGSVLGDARERTRRLSWSSAGAVLSWLALTGAVSGSGVLERLPMPLPLVLFLGGSLGVAAALALSPFGKRLALGVPIAGLVGFQAFRLPLELVLQTWKDEGVLPVQMTFEGNNFDIVTGVLALVVGLWAWRGSVPRAAVWSFNLIGSALLLAVATIAVLSSPVSFRHFLNDPPVLLAFHFPYGWIVPFCVGGALFGHILLFRRLVSAGANP